MKPITYLYLAHRWFGIVMCSFFAMWFISGIVMMYVGFPNLTISEKLDSLPALDPKNIQVSPQLLLNEISESDTVEQLRLSSILKRPAYLLKTRLQPWQAMYADNGEILTHFSAEQALAAARDFIKTPPDTTPVKIHYQKSLQLDQWTVSSSLNALRPLHKVAANETQLYISALTGQVVRDTSRNERLWNWLGANLHWIYPVQLRKHHGLWKNVIIVLSLAGIISVITGAIIGILRFRYIKPYKKQFYTPYKGIMKYHHLMGLIVLLFLSTYIFSGLMSMNPWNIFNDKKDFAAQQARYQTDQHTSSLDTISISPALLRTHLQQYSGIKEVSWHWLLGDAYIVLHKTPDQRITIWPKNTLIKDKIHSAAAKLIPDSRILSSEQLNHYDLYYYSHHQRHHPLPVLRIKFNDDESSWFHIDLTTATILERLTRKARLQRWLYNGLHSLDFNFLIAYRPAWDIVVITLCLTGLLFSLTSIYIAITRLNRKRRRIHNH